MQAIELEDIHVSLSGKPVLRGIDLTIEPGELMTFLGPSGCGKTTLLRVIAGLQQIDGGTVSILGREVANGSTRLHADPARRGVSLVFQSYALWPHMKVRDNVAFGLQVQGMKKAEIGERVHRVLKVMRIEELANRYPGELSGGQQQRVALARAIVTEPGILLLDEPLSNLDARLRVEMREEIRRLHKELKTTIIFVTHDQYEAMTLSNRVAVFFDGRIVQTAPPRELYRHPATLQIADFIGHTGFQMNVLQGQTIEEEGIQWLQTPACRFRIEGGQLPADTNWTVLIKPEDVLLHDRPNGRSVTAVVTETINSGSETFAAPSIRRSFTDRPRGGGYRYLPWCYRTCRHSLRMREHLRPSDRC
ncbi:ABC transporter ATP-binding protein [Paenibacillus hexagrammi]|uniref:ABC transporter ATP-binding protein n=1 Tax=Paenibacillus hexagrammi TaxID=2908839 RepID=A0ABY3SG68_9BACL|nr:ABC transporter ATP-binding protein [Paenibacillus sp. YPD9-1]UJF33029.1 ABC transporter ATP-binding protein [Paenibacillus sp. YPD9-1]